MRSTKKQILNMPIIFLVFADDFEELEFKGKPFFVLFNDFFYVFYEFFIPFFVYFSLLVFFLQIIFFPIFVFLLFFIFQSLYYNYYNKFNICFAAV